MDPLTIGLMSSGASMLGSLFSAKQSQENTQQTLAFQERMSSTAYQRASSDMKAAGLNPMMMFGSGSAASSPQPTVNTQSAGAGIGAAAEKAVSGAIQAKTFDQLTETISKIKADTEVARAHEKTERERPALVRADVDLRRPQALTEQERTQQAMIKTYADTLGITVHELTNEEIEAIRNMPRGLRDRAVQGGYLGEKASAITKPIGDVVSSAVRARSLARIKSKSGTATDSFGERFKLNMD